MRAIVTAVLVLLGVVGSVLSPMWTQIASAQEESVDPGMMGYRMIPEMMGEMHEMMRDMGMNGPWFHGPGDHKRPLISLMLTWKNQLGLSADQERSLKELRGNFEKESIKRTAEIDVAELDLKGLLEADKVDMAKVEASAKKIAMLRADLRVARIKTIEAGKAVLTPEQQEKFKRLLANEPMMGNMEQRMKGLDKLPIHPKTR